MSKIGKICDLLKAAGHVMGSDGLADYHVARAVRDGLRSHDHFNRARRALKNYRVRVEPVTEGGKLRLSTFDRSAELTI